MTEREFLTKVLAIEGLAEDMTSYANESLDKLNARNEKRKNTQTKTQKENEGIKTAIYDLLVEGGANVASAIGTALGISTQKASGICGLLVKEQRVTVADIKVKGKGTVKQYTAVVTETADEVADEG